MAETTDFSDEAQRMKFANVPYRYHQTMEKDHGRIGKKTTKETRYFISSLTGSAQQLAEAARQH